MTKLVLAVASVQRRKAEELLTEATAGSWPRWVEVLELSASKAENDQEVRYAASAQQTLVLAASHLTSEWVSAPNVERLQKDELLRRAMRWLDDRGLTWVSALNALRDLPGFQVVDESGWRSQFKRVHPQLGPRVARALLVQLRVVRAHALTDMLLAGGDFDYNVWFEGSDPHSGDRAMVAGLASRLDGNKLGESMVMPALPEGARVRMFADGAWSGGETEKRIKCLVTQCEHKRSFIGPTHTLTVSLGFMTNKARSRFQRRGEKLQRQGRLRSLDILCAGENILDLDAGGGYGLAFANDDINRYVDPMNPRAFYDFCKSLGEAISRNRPLGTDDIASTIAFEHSLPKAMLPLFIFSGGGAQVSAADGGTFPWKAMLVSKHVQNPARNDASHHCAGCPLAERQPAVVPPAPAASASTTVGAPAQPAAPAAE